MYAHVRQILMIKRSPQMPAKTKKKLKRLLKILPSVAVLPLVDEEVALSKIS